MSAVVAPASSPVASGTVAPSSSVFPEDVYGRGSGFVRWPYALCQLALLLAITFLVPHEALFHFMLDTLCKGNRTAYTLLAQGCIITLYWCVGCFFVYAVRHNWWPQWRMPGDKVVDDVINVPHALVCQSIQLLMVTGLAGGDIMLLAQVIALHLAVDVSAYIPHRIFHLNPWLYKTFHARHHHAKGSIAFDVHKGTILDYLFFNHLFITPAFILVSKLLPLHCASIFFFSVGATLWGLEEHSGYAFPVSPCRYIQFLSSSDHHFRHHAEPKCNYASPPIDWLFGTLVTERQYWDSKSKNKAKEQ